ncbi:hypothetical protein Vafri_10337 [Volvox africanus]|uniref:Retrotransposon gag domain-containing protein n=1 Tax=Volvox africanus TaxID=51714 RepID=A0A8J4F258_9CHLO|nr:hypothetical protein Vafri_10337 [Volvox africanus]
MEALADPAVRVALLRSLSHEPVERAQQLRRLNQFLSEQFWGPSNQPEAPHPRWGQQDQPAAGPSARSRRPSRWDQGPQEVPVPVPTNVVPETVFAPAPGTARPAATVNAPADTVTTPAAVNGSAMGAATAAAVPASPVPVTPVPVVPAVPDTVASSEAGPSTLPSAASREEVRVSMPTPVLDIEAKEDVRRLPSKVRSFIRNCEHLFSPTSWGSWYGGRCLFLTNALKGKAKEWLDDWAMHRWTYTSAELLLALEARFAPQVTSRDTEARQELSSRSYRMRPSETVAPGGAGVQGRQGNPSVPHPLNTR